MKRIILLFAVLLYSVTLNAKRIVLENESIRAEFEDKNGALVSLVNKATGWNLIPRAELGQSFRMLIPIDGPNYPIEKEMRYNHAEGTRQSVSPIVKRNGDAVIFTWNTLSSDYADNLDITLSLTAALTDGGLVFSGEVENRSEYVVEYIGWPFIGEIAIPNRSQNFNLETRDFLRELYPAFRSELGYWGVDYPTNVAVFPHDGFMLFRDNTQGMLVTEEKISDEEYLVGMLELIPGFSFHGRWPETPEMDGSKVRMQATFNHILYTPKGEKGRLNPTKVTLYKGEWHKGLAGYRNMIQKPHSINNWASDLKAWRKVDITAAEDIIKYAKQCKANGISTLVVRNWNRFVPYTLMETLPDIPRCVREAHKLGCRVILEGEFQKVDPLGPKYGELRNYLQRDPYGYYYDDTKMCIMHEKLNEFIRVDYPIVYTELGVDGYICADQNFRMQTAICFGKDHGHKVPKFIGSGIVDLNRQFAEDARKFNRNFLVGGIYKMDAESDIFDFMFLNDAPRSRVTRFLNPETNIIATINVRSAREDINTCVLNRYTVCYNDLSGTSDISRLPNVVAYTLKIEKLREAYSDYIWNANVVFGEDISVEIDGNLDYSVFKSKRTGKRAVVIANYDWNVSKMAKVSFGNNIDTYVVSPEQSLQIAPGGEISVPALSLVVAIEK